MSPFDICSSHGWKITPSNITIIFYHIFILIIFFRDIEKKKNEESIALMYCIFALYSQEISSKIKL